MVCRSFSILSVLLALAACSGPETRVRDGLIKAGASPKLADCMAKRMVDGLSYAQLQRLSTIAKSDGEKGRKHMLKRVRDLNDPEIVSVVTTSAALCATGFG